ncbi:putative zinc knuckle domain-containing protein [Tetraselmis virus 1]|uniref:Putative zinc knuckle domain-containing protein n=1 Tax=Tetraselmis virus 1 TaxID=2060617 RepID=A0A2P0VMQ1_9VIRU|nr:putative zinc knuckle domain-containing protein [Tetraselmis virus 1]AUF82188.1 putative zinc knuckle domain-containing protein [Tetraselmis virus 1]
MKKKMVVITCEDLAKMLLELPDSAKPKDIESKLFNQKGIEKNQTAKYIHSCVCKMLKSVGSNNVLDLYKKNSKGTYSVEDWLRTSKYADSTKNKFYNALNSISNPERILTKEISKHINPEDRNYFLQKANINNDRLKSRMDENMATERELENILPWEDIRKAYKEKRDKLDPQKRLIADMYIGFTDSPAAAPRRLDYGKVRLFKKKPASTKEQNYMVLQEASNKVLLHLSEFKTYSRRKEPIEVYLPDGLSTNILESYRDHPRKYLLCKLKGNGKNSSYISAQRLSDQISSTTEELTGKSIPVSGLRKSFITWLHSQNLPNSVLKKYAYQMGHDVLTATLYRKLNILESRDYSGGAAEQDIVCFRCRNKGHISKNCPYV